METQLQKIIFLGEQKLPISISYYFHARLLIEKPLLWNARFACKFKTTIGLELTEVVIPSYGKLNDNSSELKKFGHSFHKRSVEETTASCAA